MKGGSAVRVEESADGGKQAAPVPASSGGPGKKGIWWLLGGLVAVGLGAGYRWWKELPK